MSALGSEKHEPLDYSAFYLGVPPGAPEWDVFDPEGRYLGVVTLPRRFIPDRFFEDRVYGIWEDDSNVQHVMVLWITDGAGSN